MIPTSGEPFALRILPNRRDPNLILRIIPSFERCSVQVYNFRSSSHHFFWNVKLFELNMRNKKKSSKINEPTKTSQIRWLVGKQHPIKLVASKLHLNDQQQRVPARSVLFGSCNMADPFERAQTSNHTCLQKWWWAVLLALSWLGCFFSGFWVVISTVTHARVR